MESLIVTSLGLPFSGKVVIDREQLLDIVDQMRTSIPKDISEAQEVLREKDDVTARAQEEEKRILQEARGKIEALLQESEIIRAAEERAQRILREAEQQATAQRQEADLYALEVLRKLENQISGQLNTLRSGIEALDNPPS